MRYLLLFFFFFSCVSLTAQTGSAAVAKDSVEEGLSESEFIIAKEGYQQMLKSRTNIEREEYRKIIAKKLKGVDVSIDIINDKIRGLDDIRAVVTRKLTGNVHKTDFTTVEEGVEAVMRSYTLIDEVMEENKELYALMKKATVEQQLEIYKKERPKIGY